MLQHQVKSLSPSLLAKLREESDVSAEDGLQAGADRSHNRARAHHNESLHYAETIKFKLRGHHWVQDHCLARRVAGCHGGSPYRKWKIGNTLHQWLAPPTLVP